MAKKAKKRKPWVTKPGRYGTLYLWKVTYRDDDPAAPFFSLHSWAYDAEHVADKFFEDGDDGWLLEKIEKVRK